MTRDTATYLNFITTIFLTSLSITLSDLIPRFIEEPRSQVVKEFSQVTLNCKSEPASARVSWTYDGRRIGRENPFDIRIRLNSIHIRSFIYERHRGKYQCIATTSAGSIISQPAFLSKPEFGKFPQNSKDVIIKVNEGETASLPCFTPHSIPPAVVTFLFEKQAINRDERHRVLPSNTMQIAGVQRGEQGNYRCVARNPVSNETLISPSKVTILVEDPRQVRVAAYFPKTRSLITVQSKLGEDVTLECIARGSPPIRYQWKKYGGLLSNDTEQYLGNLKIKRIKVWDQGTYFCSASNGIGEPAEKMILFKVNESPVLTIRNPMKMAGVGQTVEITCDVSSPSIISTISWYHNATPVYNGLRHINVHGNVLTVSPVQHSHAGLYQCAASTLYGYTFAISRIQIASGESTNWTLRAISTINSQSGQTVNISCPTDHSPHDVHWVVGRLASADTKIDISQLRYSVSSNATLSISNVDTSDSGTYKCLSSNGRVIKSYQLNVSGSSYTQSDSSTLAVLTSKPDQGVDEKDEIKAKRRSRKQKERRRKPYKAYDIEPPSKPTVTKLSDTSVSINWSLVHNDGLAVKFFKVQYREIRPKKGDVKTLDVNIPRRRNKYILTGLTPDSVYRFRIAAVFTNHDHRFSEFSDRFHLKSTKLRPPAGHPTIVQVEPIIHDGIYAIMVRWHYRPKEKSIVTGFNLEYRRHYLDTEYTIVPLAQPEIRSFLIKNLIPDTSYEFRLNCFNSAGNSLYSNLVVKSTPGGKINKEGQADLRKPPFEKDLLIKNQKNRGYEVNEKDSRSNVKRINRNKPSVPNGLSEVSDVSTSEAHYNVKSDRSTEEPNKMLYIALGIVLSIAVIIVIVFALFCVIRQRQTNKRDSRENKIQNGDMIEDKYKNGSFVLSPMNGVGHSYSMNKSQQNGQPININVNPRSEYEQQQPMICETNNLHPSPANSHFNDGLYNTIDNGNGVSHDSMPVYSILSPSPNITSTFTPSHRPIHPSLSAANYKSSGSLPNGFSYGQHQTATPYAQSALLSSPYHHSYDEYDERETEALNPQRHRHKTDILTNTHHRPSPIPVLYPPPTPPDVCYQRQPRYAPSSHHGSSVMIDQSTNTDISSSNEGTINDSSLSRNHDYHSPVSHQHPVHDRQPRTYVSDYRRLPPRQYQYDCDSMSDS